MVCICVLGAHGRAPSGLRRSFCSQRTRVDRIHVRGQEDRARSERLDAMTTTLEPPVRGTARSRRLADHSSASPRPRPRPSCPPTSSTSSARCAPAPTCAAASWRSTARPPTPPPSCQPGADWPGHVPGQYLRIGIDVDGVRQWRAYSLTHGPRATAGSRSPSRPSPTAWSATTSSTRRARHPGPARAGGRRVRAPAGGRQVALGHRGLGHHPGDRDAAQPLPEHRRGRPPTWPAARDHDIVVVHVAPSHPHSIFIATSRSSTPPARSACRALRRRARPPRDDHLTDLVPDLAERHDPPCGLPGLLDVLEGPPTLRVCPCPPSSSAPPGSRRATAAPSPSARDDARRRRRDAHPRRRRGGRSPDAERLPHGHLLRLRPPAARGHRARPPQRRHHHRRPGETRRHQGADLHLRRRWPVRHRPERLTTTPPDESPVTKSKMTAILARPAPSPTSPRPTSSRSASSSTPSARTSSTPAAPATRRTSGA